MREDKTQPAVAGPVELVLGPLPPLPPKRVINRHLPTGVALHGYNADDMRAYAAAAVAAERERWESAIGAVMPLDFKFWHENATAERPEVAAWCIVNARKQSDLAWMQIDAARARSEGPNAQVTGAVRRPVDLAVMGPVPKREDR